MNGFIEISLILSIATLVAIIMQLLRLPLILGHILTGILVGPAILNLINAKEPLEIFAHLGITSLLFIVGLNLNPRVIKDIGKVSLITGVGQIVFTTLIGFFIARGFNFSLLSSLYLATAFTFSSTIIVMKLLSDRKDLSKLYAKLTIGFLLVQDIVATIILILTSSLNQGLGVSETVMMLVVKLLIVGGILMLISLYILPKMVRFFAQSQEFLFIFTIGWAVGLAAIFYKLGLSVEIGALVAGITLASSPYHYEISAKMKMVRDFFIVMFFILLGSQLGFSNLSALIIPAITFSLFVLIGNPLILMFILGLLGYTKKTSFYTGIAIAQISEFSFILILAGVQSGYIDNTVLTLTTLVALITMTGSSLMLIYADELYLVLAPYLSFLEKKRLLEKRVRKQINVEAVLFGCHRVGEDFLGTLKKLKIKFIVVDYNPGIIEKLERKRLRVIYGDAHDNEFLDDLSLEKKRIVISTLPDFEVNLLILSKVRKYNDDSMVILIAHTIDQAKVLYEEGATYVVLPHYLGGNYVAMMLEKHSLDFEKLSKEGSKHLKYLKSKR